MHAGRPAPSKFKFVICVRLVIVIYFRTFANVRLEDNEVSASDMTDVGLQFHEPDASPAPATILPVVLQKFGIIESRAE